MKNIWNYSQVSNFYFFSP